MPLFSDPSPLTPPGVDPAIDPLVYLYFNENWQPYIVGVIESLLDEDTWSGTPEEIDEAFGQVSNLFTQFADASMMPFPRAVFLPAQLSKINNGATRWVRAHYSSQVYAVAHYQLVRAVNDEFDFYFPHKSGTFTLELVGLKAPNLGVTRIYINGVELVPGEADWYAAATTYNVAFTWTVTFDDDGEQLVKVKVSTKNPLSTDYYVLLTCLLVY